MLIQEKFVSDQCVKHFEDLLSNCIENKIFEQRPVCTVGGKQTSNVIGFVNGQYFSEIVNLVKEYIDFYYDKRLNFYQFNIDYLHLINYSPRGYQEGHTHCRNEDHSFILYLNSNDGATRIYCDGGYKDIVPVKNKIVFFNSALYHEGLECSIEKNVLVGGIVFTHKVWAFRQ